MKLTYVPLCLAMFIEFDIFPPNEIWVFEFTVEGQELNLSNNQRQNQSRVGVEREVLVS